MCQEIPYCDTTKNDYFECVINCNYEIFGSCRCYSQEKNEEHDIEQNDFILLKNPTFDYSDNSARTNHFELYECINKNDDQLDTVACVFQWYFDMNRRLYTACASHNDSSGNRIINGWYPAEKIISLDSPFLFNNSKFCSSNDDIIKNISTLSPFFSNNETFTDDIYSKDINNFTSKRSDIVYDLSYLRIILILFFLFAQIITIMCIIIRRKKNRRKNEQECVMLNVKSTYKGDKSDYVNLNSEYELQS